MQSYLRRRFIGMTHCFRVLSTDPKVRANLYNIINSTKAKYCSKAFIKRSQHTILSRDSKGRTTLHSIMKVPQESTAQQFAFEWLHHRISSTDSKVRTTLYSIINITRKVLLSSFHLNG